MLKNRIFSLRISTDPLKVIDSGWVEEFAWGKIAFDFLLAGMKSAANTLHNRDSKIDRSGSSW